MQSMNSLLQILFKLNLIIELNFFFGEPEFQNHCHCCGRDISNLIFKCDEKREKKKTIENICNSIYNRNLYLLRSPWRKSPQWRIVKQKVKWEKKTVWLQFKCRIVWTKKKTHSRNSWTNCFVRRDYAKPQHVG